jgi:hypothetical protein
MIITKINLTQYQANLSEEIRNIHLKGLAAGPFEHNTPFLLINSNYGTTPKTLYATFCSTTNYWDEIKKESSPTDNLIATKLTIKETPQPNTCKTQECISKCSIMVGECCYFEKEPIKNTTSPIRINTKEKEEEEILLPSMKKNINSEMTFPANHLYIGLDAIIIGLLQHEYYQEAAQITIANKLMSENELESALKNSFYTRNIMQIYKLVNKYSAKYL